MLDPSLSRNRQHRLLDAVNTRSLDAPALDAIVLADPQHVYYLTAFRPLWLHFAALILFSDGRTHLIAANRAPDLTSAIDESDFYQASHLATLRPEQPAVLAQHVVDRLTERKVKRIGIDASIVSSQITLQSAASNVAVEPIDETLWKLRARKDPDEIALLRRAAACADAMYARARQIIRPGLTEIELFNELSAAAVTEAGEPMTALMGNDYRSGQGGGTPRPRAAQSGELFVIDVGPTYRGYFADACRTFSVNKNPTDEQQQAHQLIEGALKLVETIAKPGASCRAIYETVADHLKQHPAARFPHHLGHGVGLSPHEYPHLNPHWNDTLEESQLFTAEPGLYAPTLQAGIRLENMYLVTATGVENLIHSPLNLT